MRILDEIYLKDPCLGARRLVPLLERDYGIKVNRKRVRRLRQIMGVETIWCRPRTSIPDDGHRKYPEPAVGQECCAIACARANAAGVQLFEVGNGAMGEIHLQSDRLGRFGGILFFEGADEGDKLAIADGVLANSRFQTVTPTSKKTGFE